MVPRHWRRIGILAGLPAMVAGVVIAAIIDFCWANPFDQPERAGPTFLVVMGVAFVADWLELHFFWRRYFGAQAYHDLQRSGGTGLGIVGPISMGMALGLLITWGVLLKL